MRPFFFSVGGRSSLTAAKARRPVWPGKTPERSRDPIGLIPIVAGEELIAAVSGKYDFHFLGSNFADQESRKKRYVRERFVEMHDELIEEILHAWLDPLFTMLGLEESRNLPRIPCLVVTSFRETYRERLHRSFRSLCHERHDSAAVDSTGQERTKRHVAHHLRLDRPPERCPELFCPLFVAEVIIRRGGCIPVRYGCDLSPLYGQKMCREEAF